MTIHKETNMSLTDKWLTNIKNLPLIALLILFGTIVIGIAEFADSFLTLKNIWNNEYPIQPPTPAHFDQTVFVHGESGRHENVLRNRDGFSRPPSMELYIGTDKRQESIGEKGEVRFVGIPSDQLGKLTNITLNAEGYELVDPKAQVKLSGESIYVAVRPTQVQINGQVQDEKGNAVAGARLRLGNYTEETNNDGWFRINVPSNLPETEKSLRITAPGFEPSKQQITPGSGSIDVILTRN